ncbi:hypothetical protein MES4922_10312 [Mesorhizobium ventifaucium]|uniref:Uncharacterized protein n=1 Tax=Mesorhizobium ventifaucium TaxID=666020 RepID=A0ABM9DCZ6_9HYPH|nr:hypothetical protein MES4922_10312 [Mesorhizobium ventifaucium]
MTVLDHMSNASGSSWQNGWHLHKDLMHTTHFLVTCRGPELPLLPLRVLRPASFAPNLVSEAAQNYALAYIRLGLEWPRC